MELALIIKVLLPFGAIATAKYKLIFEGAFHAATVEYCPTTLVITPSYGILNTTNSLSSSRLKVVPPDTAIAEELPPSPSKLVEVNCPDALVEDVMLPVVPTGIIVPPPAGPQGTLSTASISRFADSQDSISIAPDEHINFDLAGDTPINISWGSTERVFQVAVSADTILHVQFLWIVLRLASSKLQAAIHWGK